MPAPFYSNQQLFELIRGGRMGGSLSAIFNYLVVVSPGDEISKEVRRLKAAMQPSLRDNRSLHSKAHFTIIDLPAPYCLEARIVAALARACNKVAARTIPVDGFGSFPNGDGRNVIYLKTGEDLFFAQIQQQIKRAMHDEGLKRRYARLSGKPHITVAKDLSNTSFDHWWPRMQHKNYRNSFYASKLLVLKRRPGSYTKCEVIETIPFTGTTMPVMKSAAEQKLLF